MARTLDPEAHALRRDAFIDTAQRLIQTKGYEEMSIQDVLDDLGVSRGAFYHYFDSKGDLLEAVVERMVDAALEALAPMVNDPALPARQKLEGLFNGIAGWKNARRELMVALIRVWLSDENAIVRDKLRLLSRDRIGPILARIVKQGNAEGAFSVTSPTHTADVLLSLLQGASEVAMRLFVARQTGAVTFEDVERTFAAYSEAYARILGIPGRPWPIVDEATMRLWFA